MGATHNHKRTSATGGYACCGPVGAAPARRRPAFGYSLIAIRRRRAAVRQSSVDRKVPQCYFSVVSRLARDFSRSTLCMCVDFVCMCIGFGPGSPLAGHESVAESEQQRCPAASPPRSGVFCRMPAQSLSVL